MKNFIFIVVLLMSWCDAHLAFAGTGLHGGNVLKDRFIVARELANKILEDEKCKEFFKPEECSKMLKKLKEGGAFEWYEESKCLQAPIKGTLQCVTASTEADYRAPIIVDVNAAVRSNINTLEATILLIHEAGHSIDLSDSLITDERITKLLITSPTLMSRVVVKGSDEDLSVAINGPASLPNCLSLQAALENIYDRQNVGITGIRSKGFDLTFSIHDEHKKFLGEIWNSLGVKGRKEIKAFFDSREQVVHDQFLEPAISDFTRKMEAYTLGLQKRLDEEGVLISARFMPKDNKDIHAHWVEARYANKMLSFEVCTAHYEDMHLVNHTKFFECSRLEFKLDKYASYIEPVGLGVDYRYFGDGGVYNNLIVNGQVYNLWTYPEREVFAMRGVGQDCEKIIRESKGLKP